MPSDGVTLGMPDESVQQFIKEEFETFCTMEPNAAWIECRTFRRFDGSHRSTVLVINEKGETVFQYPKE